MVDIGKKEKKDEKVDKTMSTPKKTLIFAGEDSILKSPLSRSKSQGSSQIYFRPRSNKKFTMKKDILKNILFTIYLTLSITISIQQVTEFGSTEAKLLEAVTSI